MSIKYAVKNEGYQTTNGRMNQNDLQIIVTLLNVWTFGGFDIMMLSDVKHKRNRRILMALITKGTIHAEPATTGITDLQDKLFGLFPYITEIPCFMRKQGMFVQCCRQMLSSERAAL